MDWLFKLPVSVWLIALVLFFVFLAMLLSKLQRKLREWSERLDQETEEREQGEIPQKRMRVSSPAFHAPSCPQCKSKRLVNGQMPEIGGKSQSDMIVGTVGKLNPRADMVCCDCGKFIKGR